nr:hypothetical protein [Granulosicoccus sp.]
MSRNYKFYFDKSGSPCARGPAAEKPLMIFLELDVQGSDHICRDLMDDLTAVEDETADSREFIGNAHCINITATGVTIRENLPPADAEPVIASAIESTPTQSTVAMKEAAVGLDNPTFEVGLKRFREVLEDWEAFILDDQIDDTLSEDDYS